MLELMLFLNDENSARNAFAHGLSHFLVDFESRGKEARQQGYDTEIAPATLDDLRSVAAVAGGTTWCRIDRPGAKTALEIDNAIHAGADGIFLPMVQSAGEVEDFLRQVDGRCATGILIETQSGFDSAREIAALPVDRVYFGLNDFAISRGGGSIFKALLDGSVERMREVFSRPKFGFGGVTAIDSGHPVPAKCLLQEMARLGCDFSFLRRSFRRDTAQRDPRAVVSAIEDYWRQCKGRDAATVERDRHTLEALLGEL